MSELDLRVGDDDRERVVGALQRHARAGRLDPVELDERLEAALSAKTFRELESLTADLPDETRTPQALRRRKVGELRGHLGFWITVSVICLAVWAATGADYFWPLWPIAFIGLTVVLHGLEVLKCAPDRSTSAAPSHRSARLR
ncbi:DUF1707 domain-containing protein [Solirubrobacter sp. CPCC 204708]|uniref:DUF1707 domain-containing protein n=1 Tax=Solirubrobacter deserti TaxID=2282478 RepID=A0ABT4RGR9_9ACTN|nr:DUF1707 domain-containing protein [Solirubrobacter deserti]MBE2315453.1 DUF1707 domain-containing protein [Solirubrobacter deserti]MDA0137705.1 DUF1707 domain-containing protein [Solirubrobacter deserti]